MPPRFTSSLRLIHAEKSPENCMLRANKYLGEGRTREAIRVYTEILHKLSPGHVCAFLNRSLAYVRLGVPELAVFDAYRAGILANQMRVDERNGLAIYQATTKFLRAEKLAIEGGEDWTSERRRFVQGGWTYSALSSIVINDIPDLEGPTAAKCPRFSINKRPVVCMALEIRAIYRLCGALYMCGAGARSDALGLIDDAHKRCTGMEDWEVKYFYFLGNHIVDDCMEPWNARANDPEDLACLPLNEQRRRDEERRKTKESMLAKTTKLKGEGYIWNMNEPELDNADWRTLLRSWAQQTTTNCTPHFVSTDGTWNGTSKSYVELRAQRDIEAGELLLSERTRSNVTTSTPQDIIEDPNLPPSRRYHCDTCSCLMIVPRYCPFTYKDPAASIPDPSPSYHPESPTVSVSSPSSRHPSHGSDNSNPATSFQTVSPPSAPASPQQRALPPDTPPRHPSPTPSSPPDFTLCAPIHPIPACSSHCLTLRIHYDRPLHNHPLERELRTSHLATPPIPKPLESRKHQCLVDLLLLRIFANALWTGIHPLQDRELLFASSGSGCPGKGEEQREWSFTSDVVRPIWMLDRVLQEVGTDQWARLEICDGWVITTLRSKIEKAMRVSTSPVFAKIYDGAGKVVQSVCREDSEWEDLVNCKERHAMEDSGQAGDQEVWSASIHPLFNMIRVADPHKGEVPNVRVVRREGVLCYAIGGGGAGPALTAGEALVRAADEMDEVSMEGLGGPVGGQRAGSELDRSDTEFDANREEEEEENSHNNGEIDEAMRDGPGDGEGDSSIWVDESLLTDRGLEVDVDMH